MKRAGVYIHIPYCVSKCAYCDFLSRPGKTDEMERYAESLSDEIESSEELSECECDTVFLGGGTPTAMPPFLLERIFKSLYVRTTILAGAEVTAEANPGTLGPETLGALRHMGVNRLSVGLQAWQGRLLRTLGRAHGAAEFAAQYENAINAGFSNINVDLIFGIPGQTLPDWRETLEETASFKPRHISVYGLTAEPGTPLGDSVREGIASLPDEEAERAMYGYAAGFLKTNGYAQYEISNFAIPGYECRHNIKYWERSDTLGFGLGAHSFYSGARWSNTRDYAAYISGRRPSGEGKAAVSMREAFEEAVFLGLRMNKGINADTFDESYDEKLKDLCDTGFVSLARGRVSLTEKGIDVSEKVIEILLAGRP